MEENWKERKELLMVIRSTYYHLTFELDDQNPIEILGKNGGNGGETSEEDSGSGSKTHVTESHGSGSGSGHSGSGHSGSTGGSFLLESSEFGSNHGSGKSTDKGMTSEEEFFGGEDESNGKGSQGRILSVLSLSLVSRCYLLWNG